MDPAARACSRISTRFPRTRGDGPDLPWARPGRRRVSPARAGMDPSGTRWSRPRSCFPRTRGDGPAHAAALALTAWFPPHARGWTRFSPAFPPHGWTSRTVSPARAGMDPRKRPRQRLRRGFPRTRGDGPLSTPAWRTFGAFPPHARGWTVRRSAGGDPVVSPARAGMDRSPIPGPFRRPFPPHARGWTPGRHSAGHIMGFPPHARGWTLKILACLQLRRRSFPRTRGDGPSWPLAPRRRVSFPPHARGWTLRTRARLRRGAAFPPHARGWTRTGRWESRGESLVTTWWPPPSSNGCSVTAT